MALFSQKKLSILCFTIVIFSSVISCDSKQTKEDYLSEYEVFVLKIKRNHQKYDENEWKEFDVKNLNYYSSDFKKFHSELTASETLRVHRFNFVYKFYRGDITLNKLLKGEYNQVFKGLALEMNEIYRELQTAISEFENEKNSVIIDKLLE